GPIFSLHRIARSNFSSGKYTSVPANLKLGPDRGGAEMNLINTGALARCIPENENLKPFQRLLRLVQTVKTVWRIRCLFHRAKASMLMIEPARKSGRGVNLALAGVRSGRALPVLVVLAALGLASCRPDMANQPRAKPLSESDFFSNGTSARQPPLHTVAHGDARENTALYTGLIK